jgi:hypothetical protein
VETENSPPRSGLVQQPSSAAAAALNDKKLRQTNIAAAVPPEADSGLILIMASLGWAGACPKV